MDRRARRSRTHRGRIATVVTNAAIVLLVALLVVGCVVVLWLSWVP